MKKAVIAVMVVIMTLTAAFMVSGCTDEAMQAQIDGLMDRVEDLENKNNVFWTDKAEYAETETMTVYFKDTAVFKIRISDSRKFLASGGAIINADIMIESQKSDYYAENILGESYIEWFNDAQESGICIRTSYGSDASDRVCYAKQEVTCPISFRAEEAITKGTTYDFVLCIPGTQFELARFNINLKKV